MWFIDVVLFAFFPQCSIIDDYQGEIQVENDFLGNCIGAKGSLICTWFFKTLYAIFFIRMNKEEL